jgi:hypothetical protein
VLETKPVLERRIRGEFKEMPGLRLTGPQAARLWGLTLDESESLLSDLVAAGFLRRSEDGRYLRADG